MQLGADVLRPVHDEPEGADGFVSLEVGPELARDTDGTLGRGARLWEAVDRPNVMIKIPGTDEGVPAIEEAIYEGINVNVTLLFAVEAYVKVAEAFIRGLERRQEEGKDLDVHSVASFFVSRVDSEVDKRLEAAGRTDLQGRPPWPTPAPPTSASRRSSGASALPPWRTPERTYSGRCGPPPASRTRTIPRPSTSMTWWRRTRSTRCRCRRCSPPRSARRSLALRRTRTRPPS